MEEKQAVEDWDPGLGVVRWAVVARERVVCGVELSMLVSESSEGGYSVEFPSGTAAAEGRKEESSSNRGKERERDEGRGSEGKCGR